MLDNRHNKLRKWWSIQIGYQDYDICNLKRAMFVDSEKEYWELMLLGNQEVVMILLDKYHQDYNEEKIWDLIAVDSRDIYLIA